MSPLEQESQDHQIPKPLGESIPCSYEIVPNPALREHLKDVEARLGAFDESPIPFSDIRDIVSYNLGLQPWLTQTLYDLVRREGIIQLLVEKTNAGRRYFFTKDMVRAFSAIAFGFKSTLLQRDRLTKETIRQRIADLKHALGSHPITNFIQEPLPNGRQAEHIELTRQPNQTGQSGEGTEQPIQPPRSSEFNLSTGPFWETPLGETVRSWATPVITRIGLSPNLATAQAGERLGLRHEMSYLIPHLARSGVLHLERRPKLPKLPVYILETNHLLAAGLILLFLQRGYSLSQAGAVLTQSLEGTGLESCVGRLRESYRGKTSTSAQIFRQDSPWLRFPLEPAKIKEQAPKVADTLTSENLDLEALKSLLAIIPQNDGLTAFSFQKVPISQGAFRDIMLIDTVDAHTSGKRKIPGDFTAFLNGVTFFEFERAVKTCIKFMEKYGKIKNIKELCEAVEQKLGTTMETVLKLVVSTT